MYAYDIARLPHPDGPVSSELLDSQVRARSQPEAAFPGLLDGLDKAFEQAFGVCVLKQHDDKTEFLARVHRFRALDCRERSQSAYTACRDL
jgi:hypothetical protein